MTEGDMMTDEEVVTLCEATSVQLSKYGLPNSHCLDQQLDLFCTLTGHTCVTTDSRISIYNKECVLVYWSTREALQSAQKQVGYATPTCTCPGKETS